MDNNRSNTNLRELSIDDSDVFSIDDLLYVASKAKSIDFLQERLLNVYQWTHGLKTLSYTEMAKRNGVHQYIMPILKELGYCDKKCNWIPKNKPRKADAVYISLKIRNYNKERKIKS